jgi:hypothetical protein
MLCIGKMSDNLCLIAGRKIGGRINRLASRLTEGPDPNLSPLHAAARCSVFGRLEVETGIPSDARFHNVVHGDHEKHWVDGGRAEAVSLIKGDGGLR